MQRLYRKRIVLGVGGGIAAYKSAELVRRLRDRDVDVQVVMTAGAREFVARSEPHWAAKLLVQMDPGPTPTLMPSAPA